MEGEEFKAIRHKLGLSTKELGRAIGYQGNENTISVQVRQYEAGGRPIPPWIARLVYMFGKFGVPKAWLR